MKLIGLRFGETVEFMTRELPAFARGKILSPSVISVLSFFKRNIPVGSTPSKPFSIANTELHLLWFCCNKICVSKDYVIVIAYYTDTKGTEHKCR
jgi:hypothetical protein